MDGLEEKNGGWSFGHARNYGSDGLFNISFEETGWRHATNYGSDGPSRKQASPCPLLSPIPVSQSNPVQFLLRFPETFNLPKRLYSMQLTFSTSQKTSTAFRSQIATPLTPMLTLKTLLCVRFFLLMKYPWPFCKIKYNRKLSPGQTDSLQVNASFRLALNLRFVWPPTCVDLRWVWSSSKPYASRHKFFTVWPLFPVLFVI